MQLPAIPPTGRASLTATGLLGVACVCVGATALGKAVGGDSASGDVRATTRDGAGFATGGSGFGSGFTTTTGGGGGSSSGDGGGGGGGDSGGGGSGATGGGGSSAIGGSGAKVGAASGSAAGSGAGAGSNTTVTATSGGGGSIVSRTDSTTAAMTRACNSNDPAKVCLPLSAGTRRCVRAIPGDNETPNAKPSLPGTRDRSPARRSILDNGTTKTSRAARHRHR